MLHAVALGMVLLAGLYLVGLGVTALVAPARATRFLLRFAGTARAHYVELALRSVVGGAFILLAPRMRFADVFAVFGWVLLLTTLGLAAMPWRWHRAFARRAVPYATRHPSLVGGISLVLGGLVLVAATAAA